MLRFRLVIALLLLPFSAADARKPEASWNNHCEHCHGDHAEFARKYLWNVDGQLQGRHHIDGLDLFMQNHYVSAHEIEAMTSMLLDKANSPLRFDRECSECHGEAAVFVEQSIWVRGDSMTALKTGIEVGDFLSAHRGLQAEDVEFYLELFERIAR